MSLRVALFSTAAVVLNALSFVELLFFSVVALDASPRSAAVSLDASLRSALLLFSAVTLDASPRSALL